MALEAADIQDSTIMGMSKQETNDTGRMKFIAALPSGRELSSEFFDPGRKRDALLAWLPAVRSAILADDEEARAQAKRNATAIPAIVASVQHIVKPQLGAGETDRMDPLDYVKGRRQQAELDLQYWTGVAVGATGEMEAARAALTKWTQIEQSIGGMVSAKSTEDCRSGAAIGSSAGTGNGNELSAVRSYDFTTGE